MPDDIIKNGNKSIIMPNKLFDIINSIAELPKHTKRFLKPLAILLLTADFEATIFLFFIWIIFYYYL